MLSNLAYLGPGRGFASVSWSTELGRAVLHEPLPFLCAGLVFLAFALVVFGAGTRSARGSAGPKGEPGNHARRPA